MPDATLEDLDETAVAQARVLFRDILLKNEPDAERQAALKSEIAEWDTVTLLNKARITKAGKITRSALLLLGKNESTHFLSPGDIKLIWILREADESHQ